MSQESLQKLVAELDVLIRARYPLIAANTHEEGRFKRVMHAIAHLKCHHAKDKGLYLWSRTTGLRQTVGADLKGKEQAIPNTEDPISVLEHIAGQEKGLFVLCDYSPYLAPYGQEDPQLVRRLRELAWQIKSKHTTVLFVEQNFPEITALAKEVKAIELPLPDEREVAIMLDVQMEKLAGNDVPVEVDERAREKLVQALLGLTETDIENVLAKAVVSGGGLTAAALPVVLREAIGHQRHGRVDLHPPRTGGQPRRLLESAAHPDRSGGDFHPGGAGLRSRTVEGLADGGFAWLRQRPDQENRLLGLGQIALGFGFRERDGRRRGRYRFIGHDHQTGLIYRHHAEGILGISEFEKAVGGLESSSRTDGGETARTIAYLLNWMQEQSEVFVIGTANDVRGLAAEQTRQGRFSHIVFVDLPTEEDRRAIAAVHLRKRQRDPAAFDLDAIATATKEFSGAEIEAAVKAGLLHAFMDGQREITTADIVARAGQIQPTSVVKREQVESLRRWAKDHLALDAGGNGLAPLSATASAERAIEI